VEQTGIRFLDMDNLFELDFRDKVYIDYHAVLGNFVHGTPEGHLALREKNGMSIPHSALMLVPKYQQGVLPWPEGCIPSCSAYEANEDLFWVGCQLKGLIVAFNSRWQNVGTI
jgi:hypothetical protein